MKQALGLVEIRGLSTAVVVADTMVKAANIRILEIENTKGLGYMTIKIEGDVGAIKAAVDAGCQIGRMNGRLVSSKVIPRPSDYVENTFCKKEAAELPVSPQPPEPKKLIEEVKIIETAKEEAEPEEPVEAVGTEPEKSEEPVTEEDSEKTEEREAVPGEETDPTVPEVKKTTRRTGSDKRKK